MLVRVDIGCRSGRRGAALIRPVLPGLIVQGRVGRDVGGVPRRRGPPEDPSFGVPGWVLCAGMALPDGAPPVTGAPADAAPSGGGVVPMDGGTDDRARAAGGLGELAGDLGSLLLDRFRRGRHLVLDRLAFPKARCPGFEFFVGCPPRADPGRNLPRGRCRKEVWLSCCTPALGALGSRVEISGVMPKNRPQEIIPGPVFRSHRFSGASAW